MTLHLCEYEALVYTVKDCLSMGRHYRSGCVDRFGRQDGCIEGGPEVPCLSPSSNSELLGAVYIQP